jgi:hypothetical protein
MQCEKEHETMTMMNEDPSLGVSMHCTVCTVRVSSSDAAPVQVISV